jgi:hypothetical protein
MRKQSLCWLPWRSSPPALTPDHPPTCPRKGNAVTKSFLTNRYRFAVLLLPCLLAAGCQPGTGRDVPPVETNMKNLAIFYGRYVAQHRRQTPPDKEAFKKFIAGHPAAELAALKITDVEQLFVSPRDKQPYVVRYKFALPPPSPTGSPVIAYEKDGVSGRRFVAFANAGAEEVDDASFRKLVPQP